MILRAGLGAEELAWAAIFLVAPVSGVYYPIGVLPGWLQAIAWTLPSAHVFEGMRARAARRHVSAGTTSGRRSRSTSSSSRSARRCSRWRCATRASTARCCRWANESGRIGFDRTVSAAITTISAAVTRRPSAARML